MRYPKDQRERTRRHVVETAARVLRRDGLAATGILPLMREAGLTQGAFYKTFGSRDELLIDAIALAVKQSRRFAQTWRDEARTENASAVETLIDRYLSERHLDAHDGGCILATLGPELGRQSDDVRRAASALIDDMLDGVAAEFPVAQRWIVRPLYMMMAGILANARLAVTRGEQLTILNEGRRAARLLGPGPIDVSVVI